MVIVLRDQYVTHFPQLTDVEAQSAYISNQLFAKQAG